MTGKIFRQMTAGEIARWYETDLCEAFAENERKPLADIYALIDRGRYEVWGLFAAGVLQGYAALWKGAGIPLTLLDYLGVSAALRSGGIGAELLAHLKAQGTPLVTESELPVEGDSDAANDLRRRRIGFYVRNGFAPAYEMATCGMRWQALLANTGGLAMDDIMGWHKALYGPERTDVRVPLRRDETPQMPYWMQ